MSAAAGSVGGGTTAAALEATIPPGSVLGRVPLDVALRTSLYGTTPPTSLAWLAVDAPHSGTAPDLVGTTCAALAVLGLCLLLTRTAAGARALLPLSAPGSMSLSLYTAHVVLVAPMGLFLGPVPVYVLHALGAVAVGLLFLLGSFAVRSILVTEASVGSQRGKIHHRRFGDVELPIVVSYHPAYLLRNLADKRKSWEDLLLLADELGRVR